MADVEGGSFVAECVAVDIEAMDVSREGEVGEGGEEAFVQL